MPPSSIYEPKVTDVRDKRVQCTYLEALSRYPNLLRRIGVMVVLVFGIHTTNGHMCEVEVVVPVVIDIAATEDSIYIRGSRGPEVECS